MKDHTLKISPQDFIQLEELRVYMMRKRHITITKKGLIGYLIRRATNELLSSKIQTETQS